VWFIGTANHDETTAEFAEKTYDRAQVMELQRPSDKSKFKIQSKSDRNAISYTAIEQLFEDAANRQASLAQKAAKWLREAEFTKTLEKRFRVGWGNRLDNQIARYLPVVVEAGGSTGEAIDHLLATKVLRKLKDRHDVRATALEELLALILTGWDNLDKSNPPEQCCALIEKEISIKKGEDLV
jgi:hypothetical protein